MKNSSAFKNAIEELKEKKSELINISEEKSKNDPKKVEEKEVFEHLGVVSFSSATRQINRAISERSNTCVQFEEKKTGVEWQIKVELKKTDPEIFVDDKGKKWKRVY